jgi:hypothetical protein
MRAARPLPLLCSKCQSYPTYTDDRMLTQVMSLSALALVRLRVMAFVDRCCYVASPLRCTVLDRAGIPTFVSKSLPLQPDGNFRTAGEMWF